VLEKPDQLVSAHFTESVESRSFSQYFNQFVEKQSMMMAISPDDALFRAPPVTTRDLRSLLSPVHGFHPEV
jgi:hypothetical protein